MFVVGCPRSGTTFLYDTILSSGNFAVYRTESDVFNRIAAVYGDRSLSSRANRVKLMDFWLKSDHFKWTGLDAGPVLADVLENCRNAGDFMRIFMERTARSQGVERWADNTPAHVLHIPRIKATIPDALFIHIIRDGRDVATSMNHLGWPFEYRCPWDKAHGLLISAFFWEWTVRKGRQYGRRVGADYMEVRYEDLIHRPKATLQTLSGFIHHDLNYERILQNAIGTVRTPNSSFNGATSNATFKPVGRWKGIEGEEAERMEALLSPILRELGYEVNPSARLDFTARRMRAFYRVYRELKHILKVSPLRKYVTDLDRFNAGYLDRETAFFKALQESSPRRPKNS